MGWKGTLRSLNASTKRSFREQQKQQRSLGRSMTKIDRNSEVVYKKAEAFEAQLRRDPIKVLNLRYIAGRGFQAEPFRFSTDLYSGEIKVVTEAADAEEIRFQPNDFKAKDAVVRTHKVFVSNWGTAVGISVAHDYPDWRLKLNWVKKSEPSRSSVFILDKENNQYYFPIATDLKGDVLPGHPFTGVIVFEKFRIPTSSIEMHFSNVKLSSSKGDNHSFSFKCDSPNLKSVTSGSINQPSIVAKVSEAISIEEEKLKEHVRKSHSGCLLLLLTFGSTFCLMFLLVVSTF